MGKVIIPKFNIYTGNEKIVFLFGPIRNAPNWHDSAIEILLSEHPSMLIASPRRSVDNPRLAKYVLPGVDLFPRQRAWEWNYQEKAAKNGVLLFWLPGEDKSAEDYSPEKVYGAMTRIELGQWMTRCKFDSAIKMCIGTDGNFPEFDTIKYDLSLHLPEMQIQDTLEKTCLEAMRLSRL